MGNILTDATSRAKPDIEAVDISTRISTINEIFEVTTKPLIFDGDTGGFQCNRFTIKSLERLGCVSYCNRRQNWIEKIHFGKK